jgi:hypothetical protein
VPDAPRDKEAEEGSGPGDEEKGAGKSETGKP